MKKLSMIFCLIAMVFIFTGCQKKKNTSFLAGTTWKDKQEITFTEDRITWYRYPDQHDDNYYSGTYKFYRGDEAVKFASDNYGEFGITSSKIDSMFSEKNKKEDFVVLDIYFDKYIRSGKEGTITTPHAPWFGFLINDGKTFDIVDIVYADYYQFTKVD